MESQSVQFLNGSQMSYDEMNIYDTAIMKRKTTYIIILAALVLAGCQSEEIEITQNSGDRTVKYAVASSQLEWTKAACETNASLLMLSDKECSISIPVECVVTEGIGVSPEKSVQTK